MKYNKIEFIKNENKKNGKNKIKICPHTFCTNYYHTYFEEKINK